MQRDVPISNIIRDLQRDSLLPAILFRTSRSQCDTDALRAAGNQRMHLPPARQRELRLMVHDVIEKYDMDRELITSHPQYNALILTGVGAHHAGQLLMWRLLLEELMASGNLRVLVATGTVAAGVDFPARSVIITAHSKRGAEGYNKLSSAEFQQMSGRAGRRGRDTVGYCVVAPSMFCDARQLLRISRRPPEPLVSAYYPGPSTVLNLLRYRNVDDLRFTVQRSLASFKDRKDAKELLAEADALEERVEASIEPEQKSTDDNGKTEPLTNEQKRERKKVRRLRRQAGELETRQMASLESSLDGLKSLGYLEESSLSEKGYWAANLCTSLVLELAEMIEEGLFEDVSAEELAALIACVAGDSHRKYLVSKTPSFSEEVTEQVNSILKRVSDTGMPGVQEGRELRQEAAYTVSVWMQAESWQEFRGLLILSGVAEGDAARLITQTADHLNQLTRLFESHRQLAMAAEEAKRRILRPPLTENIESI